MQGQVTYRGFREYCRSYCDRIAGYTSEIACERSIFRIKKIWKEVGSYGCLCDDRDAVIAAAQDRFLGIRCERKEQS